VRALDARLDWCWAAQDHAAGGDGRKRRIEARVDRETRDGLSLVRPFFALLPEFESSGQPFDEYLSNFFQRLPECGP